MADNLISVDEFLSERKDFVKDGDILVKAAKAPTSWNAEKRTARFTMSAEIEDRDRDIVYQAGLDVTEFLKNPIAPYMHQAASFPVGSWTDVQKNLTGRPKRTEGTLQLVPEGVEEIADRLAKHIEAGTIRACSIGFRPKSIKRREIPDDKKDSPYYYPGYEIMESELYECSPVTIPANPAALAKSAARGDVLARETIEEILDTWTRTSTGLLIPREELEGLHKEATNGRTVVVVVGANVDAKAVEDAVAKALTQTEKAPDVATPSATPDPSPENSPASNDATGEPEITRPQARSLLRRAFDLLAGTDDIEAKLQQELRDAEHAEAEDAEAKEQRKQALQARLAEIEPRAQAKALAT